MNIQKPFLLLLLAAVSAGCVFEPAEDPVMIRLDEIDQRVGSIERVVRNESLLQIATELELLREEVRELRGSTEALQYESQGAATRQREQYLDLDQRLQSLERRTRGGEAVVPGAAVVPVPQPGEGAAGETTPVPAATPAPRGDEQASYQAALELLRQGRYPQAEEGFKRFLADFPDSELADNAVYWLAETYYVNRDFETALATFRQVLEQYPNSRKSADALLKAGFCEFELKRLDAARATLESVVAQYPDTTAARLASQRLDRIASERR